PPSFLSLILLPPRSPLFPYTTLFRSYPGLAVPLQAVQHILNRVIVVFVCHDGESRHQLLFTGQTVVLLKVKEQIFDIGIGQGAGDRKSTRLNSSHVSISYAVFCLKKK